MSEGRILATYLPGWAVVYAVSMVSVLGLTSVLSTDRGTLVSAAAGLTVPFAIDPLVWWLVAGAAHRGASQAVFMSRWALSLLAKLAFLGGGAAVLIHGVQLSGRPLLLALAFGFIVCSSHQAVRLVSFVSRRSTATTDRAQECSA